MTDTKDFSGDTVSDTVLPRGRILVVEDCPTTSTLVSRLLTHDGHTVLTASDGQQALEVIAHEPIDLILMDVLMPRRDGFEACRILKHNPLTRRIPVVLVTGLQDASSKRRAVEAGADEFLAKPVNPLELRTRVGSLLRLKQYTDDLESAEAVIVMLGEAIEARDAYTVGHCKRLAAYAVAMGRELALDQADVLALEIGGFLHDIGKICLPDGVLQKAAPLTPDEYLCVRQHPVIGDRICGGLHSLRRVRGIVRHHHERLDGSGYPDGLRGDATPLLAQIMSIVDTYDAIRTVRSYKPARGADAAVAELRNEVSQGRKRSDLVDTFIGLVEANRLPQFEMPLIA